MSTEVELKKQYQIKCELFLPRNFAPLGTSTFFSDAALFTGWVLLDMNDGSIKTTQVEL